MKTRLLALGLMWMIALQGCGDDAPGMDAATDVGTDATAECEADADCDDGLFCNGAETCAGGACVPGAAPDCADALDCTLDLCDEEAAACVNVAPDADGDGVRDAACLDADGAPLGEDCDDTDPNRYPGNREVCDAEDHDEDCDPETFGAVDRDGDGYFDARCCNPRPDGTSACGDDCDDVRPNVNLAATEACDGVDNDCNGNIDEGVLVDGYVDADRDGFGDATMPLTSCPGRAGFVPAGGPTDCDDADVARNPGQVEICDGVDNDCNDLIDDDPRPVTWYLDLDGDGFGDEESGTTVSCAPPAPDPRGSYVLLDTDCNDAVAAINPAAAELCDGLDNDCNGVADYEIGPGDFEDDDADGLADVACGAPRGIDCDDGDPITGGGQPEACDGRDNDCDGSVDEGAEDLLWFYDGDGDGHGSSTDPSHPVVRSCSAPPGYVGSGADCDDTDPARRPGGTETCNAEDDDCDGAVDEGGVCGCPPGLADCDGDGLCEVNTDSDEAHCGGCDNVCSPGANGRSALCISGTCQITSCDPGFDNCDDDTSTGCEANLNSDSANCGGCGRACPSTGPNVLGARCEVGVCRFDCLPDFADCDGDPSNGCETRVKDDPRHCGGCGMDCGSGPIEPICMDGACTFPCTSGQTDDCDADPSNGCETFLGDPANCGMCGAICSPSTTAGAFCEPDPFGFVCRRPCAPGRADCDGDPGNGCEAMVSATSCGCPGDPARDCTTERVGVRDPACVGFEAGISGADCTFSGCLPGFRDCGGFCADLASDPRNCGGCGIDCGSGTCARGTCDCGPSGTFCDGAGCVDTMTDPGHCGGCNSPCGPTEFCDAGACAPMGGGGCMPPFVDCGGSCVDLNNDPSNCGSCGVVCPPASDPILHTGPGTSFCYGGRCQFACANGYGDCDFDPANGCETHTSNDTFNCGACGKACGVGGVCALGFCDGVRDVAVGPEHTCAVRDGGAVVCWGDNAYGEVDPTNVGTDMAFPLVVALPGPAIDVAVGRDHTCAIVEGSPFFLVYCWGRNDSGQLGDGTVAPRPGFSVSATMPASAPFPEDLVAGDDHTCAIVRTMDGSGVRVACWGNNSAGQTGNGSMGGNVPTPTLTAATVPAASLAAGAQHTCAVPADVASTGQIWCWGANGQGQLGLGTLDDTPTPSALTTFFPPVSSPADVQIAAGALHTCVLVNNTQLYCMGSDATSQTGAGNTVTPQPAGYPSVSRAETLVAGVAWTCLAYENGQVRCRGKNDTGIVDPSRLFGSGLPWERVEEMGNIVASLHSGGSANHVCALTFEGRLYCWGDATGGKTGTGQFTGVQFPAQVSELTP